jgi:hypothetical protein
VRAALDAWLADRGVDAAQREQVAGLWPTETDALLPAEEVHERLLESLALVDNQVRQVWEYCAAAADDRAPPEFAFLADDALPVLVRANVRLHFGRCLMHRARVDEALVQLATLQPEEVVDPATLLFYQGVVHQQTLNRDAAVAALDRLLEREAAVPQRYRSLAQLMQADLAGLKDGSLDHISRRMDDVRRRLDLGHAGPKVRGVQDGVIASLDKLIKEMEEREAAAQAAAAASGRSSGQRPSNPAPDSRPLAGKGEGATDKKPIGSKSGWGDLPPKEREEALQQIGQEFPAHYRDVIEQYFRKIASDSAADR